MPTSDIKFTVNDYPNLPEVRGRFTDSDTLHSPVLPGFTLPLAIAFEDAT